MIYLEVIDEIKFKVTNKDNDHYLEQAGSTQCKTCKARKATLNVNSNKILNI